MNESRKKNTNNTMYMFWSIAIVACLLVVVFSLILSSCSSANPTPTGTASPPPSDTATPDNGTSPSPGGVTTDPTTDPSTPAESTTLLAESEDAGQEYIDRMIFLGDSTTNGLYEYDMLTGGHDTKQVWTPTSGYLTLAYQSDATILYRDTGEEISILEAVTRKQPDILVITLGVNGVSFMDEDYFKEEYTKLIQTVQAASPDTKIICNSIYPVENDYKDLSSINNTNIPTANGWIYDVAVATGTRYTDSASVLKLADGSLDESLGNGDGIHLNSDGYQAVLDYLSTHAYK